MKNNSSNVYYICFYADKEIENKIIVYPSVISKIDYITSKIKAVGKKTSIVSIAPSIRGRFNGYEKQIDAQETHVYLKSNCSKNSIFRRFNYIIHNIRILFYLIRNVKKGDSVLVYHSLYNRFWFKLYSKISKRNIILQIEDVFSALSEGNQRFSKREWALFVKMNKCICVNDILREDLSCVPNTVTSYGSYELPILYKSEISKRKRIVYAGVIEQERKAAFLAVQSMRFLPEDYELHILGFGKDEDIKALKEEIDSLNSDKCFSCAEYHGRMQGEEYYRFLQSCDIALSTHVYDETNVSSADYTFPSKVIVYLANDLRVVAQRLRVLEKSAVSECIEFYDEPCAKEVADAITRSAMSGQRDSRKLICELDKAFVEDLRKLLEV